MSESAGCEAALLGREPVRGTTNAASLAALVRLLSRRSPESRRHYRLHCSTQSGLELVPARRADDEGFESDEDANSLGSCDDATSNSSLCCFVEDHALKSRQAGQLPSPTCSLATDSANSSGASDNDDAENALLAQDNAVPSKETKTSNSAEFQLIEAYSIGDVAFCHTDPSLPKTVVWVVKTRSRVSLVNSQLVSGDSGLEAIVFQARSEDKLRELCNNYQELSRRNKLDHQFRHPHRRKEGLIEHNSTLNRLALKEPLRNSSHYAVQPPHHSTNSKPINASVNVRTLKHSKDYAVHSSSGGNKYNLVQRTDEDGVTHIEVSRDIEDEVSSPLMEDDLNGPSSIISISTPDDGNIMLSSTVTNCNSLGKSRFTNEIESVIRTDVDTSMTGTRKEHLQREWRPSSPISSSVKCSPPQRPERRKFVKKNQAKEQAPIAEVSKPGDETKRTAASQQKVVRGQFVRVNVEQAASPGPPATNRGWLYLSEAKPSGQVLSYAKNTPSWSTSSSSNSALRRLKDENVDCGGSHKSLQMYPKRSYQRRSRSSGSGRRSRSPPARRTPMAYRYIDTVPESNTLSNRFFGKLREMTSGSVSYGTLSRRRNSSGDLPAATAQFYHYDFHSSPKNSAVTKSTPNLKSVIKKSGKASNEIVEPKKVTFSAYATVQVVD